MNCAGKTWAQILMLPLRKCTQSHLQSLRLKGPLLTPLPWNSRTRMESFSFLSSHDLNCKVHCSRELMLLNDHYRSLVEIIDWEHRPHYWEITYALSKDFPIPIDGNYFILINPLASYSLSFHLNIQIPCAIQTDTCFITSFQINYFLLWMFV